MADILHFKKGRKPGHHERMERYHSIKAKYHAYNIDDLHARGDTSGEARQSYNLMKTHQALADQHRALHNKG